MKRSINGRTWEGDADTLNEFARHMSELNDAGSR